MRRLGGLQPDRLHDGRGLQPAHPAVHDCLGAGVLPGTCGPPPPELPVHRSGRGRRVHQPGTGRDVLRVEAFLWDAHGRTGEDGGLEAASGNGYARLSRVDGLAGLPAVRHRRGHRVERRQDAHPEHEGPELGHHPGGAEAREVQALDVEAGPGERGRDQGGAGPHVRGLEEGGGGLLEQQRVLGGGGPDPKCRRGGQRSKHEDPDPAHLPRAHSHAGLHDLDPWGLAASTDEPGVHRAPGALPHPHQHRRVGRRGAPRRHEAQHCDHHDPALPGTGPGCGRPLCPHPILFKTWREVHYGARHS
mmetsp:Transcript_95541/g.270093  ORF Transcript_95541/g.270093 Transcript_95541/m.270093 type:complete len:304 (-) Transcript_95541:1962-2873(-)